MDLNSMERIYCKVTDLHGNQGTSEHFKFTLNSAYNEVTFNKKLAITKENLCTKYTPLTYKYVGLNEKLPIMKQNLHIFFVIGRVECTCIHMMLQNQICGSLGKLELSMACLCHKYKWY